MFTELGLNNEGLIRFVEFNKVKDIYNARLRLGLVFRDLTNSRGHA